MLVGFISKTLQLLENQSINFIVERGCKCQVISADDKVAVWPITSLTKMKIAILTIAAVLALTGCAKNDLHGFAIPALKDAIAKKEIIELKKFTAFSWDKVHFFAPYAPPDVIKKEVGQDVPFPRSDSEGYCLVVFMTGNTVVVSVEVGRNDADFSMLHRPGGYSPEEAKFTVEQSADGGKKLKRIAAGNVGWRLQFVEKSVSGGFHQLRGPELWT